MLLKNTLFCVLLLVSGVISLCQCPYLVLSGMFLFFHFSQSDLQIVNVFLQLGTLVLQLALLGDHIGAHLLLVLQSLHDLFYFGLQLDFSFDEKVTAVLCIS